MWFNTRNMERNNNRHGRARAIPHCFIFPVLDQILITVLNAPLQDHPRVPGLKRVNTELL